MVSNRRLLSFNFIFGNRKKSQGAKLGENGVWVMADILYLARNSWGEDGSARRGVVMVKQPGLFSPKFGATSSHVFTQSPQNVAVEPGIHSLAYWDRCFALTQLLYRWRHQSGMFWILDKAQYDSCWRTWGRKPLNQCYRKLGKKCDMLKWNAIYRVVLNNGVGNLTVIQRAALLKVM
jgi:hypothetical protein